MALMDIVNVPAGSRIKMTTTPPGDEVSSYIGHRFKKIGNGDPVLIDTWPPSVLEGTGGIFTMDLTSTDDMYIVVITAVGTKAGTIKEKLTYTPPPPPAKAYASAVKNGTTTAEWVFFLATDGE